MRRCNPIFCATITKHRFPLAEKEIMANLSKLIFGAAIAATSISTPALAAHNGKPISAHHNGYVTGEQPKNRRLQCSPVTRAVALVSGVAVL